MKPLYSEQSWDPKICSLYRGVHPRGVIYPVCSYIHVPEIQCTHTKTVSFLLWDSSGGRVIFHDSFFLFIFYDFLDFFYTCISHRLIVYHSSSIHSHRLDVHTITAICKLIGIWPISLNCSHDWETNKTLSTW